MSNCLGSDKNAFSRVHICYFKANTPVEVFVASVARDCYDGRVYLCVVFRFAFFRIIVVVATEEHPKLLF